MTLADDVNLEKLASTLLNYTGADIQALCYEAGLQALRENIKAKKVYTRHFEQAKNIIYPSINEKIADFYTRIEELFRTRSTSKIIQKDKYEFY